MFLGTLVGGLLSIANWKSPVGNDWWPLLGLGVFGFFGQLFMTKAFQIAKTNLVALLKYIEVIFTICIGIFWFGDIYIPWSFLGILLIVGSLLANVLISKR